MSGPDEDVYLDSRRIERNTKKVGLREGISDGQDKNFQKGFDDGYREGFRHAFAISQYKAALAAKANFDKLTFEPDPLLEQPERAWCHMCQSQNFLKQSVPEIVAKQTEIINRNLKSLHNKYLDKIELTPDQLN